MSQLPIKQFHLGDVISAAFGVLVSPRHIAGVYETLNFLTGDELYTHQLPRAGRAVQPYVLDQHPQLAPLAAAVKDVTRDNWRAWLDEQIARYGEHLDLSPLPDGAWLHVNALDELETMVGKDRIVVVKP
jgi:hypothetical protein